MEYVLNVFVVFELFEKLVDAFALLRSNVLNIVGDAYELRRDDFIAVFLEVLRMFEYSSKAP